MSHTTQTGTVIFNLSERLADSVSHRDWLSPALIHKNIKAKSETHAYFIIGHTLNICSN